MKKNNFHRKIYNIKGEAKILQKIVNDLKSNIPQYEKQFINNDFKSIKINLKK